MRRGLVCIAWAAAVLPNLGSSVGAARQAGPPPLRNQLVEASSPYLRSAAKQLVHWQEWSNDVFALARKLDRPIYLDIGAIWCHWCHEMDRESYGNPAIAALINELFIPVKVDRDVRPDIDRRYQGAVTELAGSGGWPLTVFLTPDGHVFYGATYLPPDTLKAVLPQAAQGYREDLYYLTQETRFRDFARVTIETFAGRARDEGAFMAAFGIAAQEYLEYPTTAVVIGRSADPVAASLYKAALTTYGRDLLFDLCLFALHLST